MRDVMLIVAGVAAVLLAFFELAILMPIPWWLYLAVALMFTAGLIRPQDGGNPMGRLGVLAALCVALAALYVVNWSTRKPFLADLAKVQPGMTEDQVRRLMGRYMEGTGWPLPLTGANEEDSGQLTIPHSVVFRHSNDGRFNSDWGIVTFMDGRVTKVAFSAD